MLLILSQNYPKCILSYVALNICCSNSQGHKHLQKEEKSLLSLLALEVVECTYVGISLFFFKQCICVGVLQFPQ